MNFRKILLAISIIVSVLCLAIGYEIAGRWLGIIITILLLPGWLLARKQSYSWLRLTCLLTSIGLAVTGRLLGLPPLLMLFGSTIALAAWDLVLFDAVLSNSSAREQTRRYENQHIQSLLLVLSFSLLVIFLGRLAIIQIPFIVLILLVAFILFALDRIWNYIKKSGNWTI
ncbi:MAG: hypothetical protein QM730_22600 [Anaerolineales bacterium]